MESSTSIQDEPEEPPSQQRTIRWIGWVLLLCSACCLRAPQAIDEARLRLEEARTAGAEQYAAELYRQALTQTEQAEELRSHRRCAGSAEKARQAAELAYEAELEASRTVQSAHSRFICRAAELESRLAQLPPGYRHDWAAPLTEARQMLTQARALLAEGPRSAPEALSLLPAVEDGLERALEGRCREEEQLREKAHREEAARRAEPVPTPRPDRYVVQSGDSLRSIAGRPEILDDSSLWKLLYAHNRDRIADPNLLFPGQELWIPREETEEAR